MTNFTFAFIASAVFTVLFGFYADRRLGGYHKDKDGWMYILPSRTNYIVAATSFALMIVFVYFLAIGGSELPDFEKQNILAVLLVIALFAIAVHDLWICFDSRISWRGNKIRINYLSGKKVLKQFSDVKSVRKSDISSQYRVAFNDGFRLIVPSYFRGSRFFSKDW